MVRLRLNVEGEIVAIEINRVINAGYSGRDEADVQAHIDELLKDNVMSEEPDAVPVTYQLSPYTLLANPSRIQVVGEGTSGEAEYGLVVTGDETYVVAASDQTDRDLEKHGIQKSKQIAPNVISADAWRLSDVRDHWDDLHLRAHNSVDEEREPYQDSSLAEILPPGDILNEVSARYAGTLSGTAILSGTVPTVGGELVPGDRFEVELHDSIRDRTIETAYDVEPI
jgi:2-keto-4-pentenoate hydratase/2-oxohepta-3-ene-1,7-dioic acid hydratase in catechol pathway